MYLNHPITKQKSSGQTQNKSYFMKKNWNSKDKRSTYFLSNYSTIPFGEQLWIFDRPKTTTILLAALPPKEKNNILSYFLWDSVLVKTIIKQYSKQPAKVYEIIIREKICGSRIFSRKVNINVFKIFYLRLFGLCFGLGFADGCSRRFCFDWRSSQKYWILIILKTLILIPSI